MGAACKLLKGKPLVLDVDDWERGLIDDNYRLRTAAGRLRGAAYSLLYPLNTDSYLNILLSEKLIPRADAVTVSNRFLLSLFGDLLVNHCRISRSYSPDRGGREGMRAASGVREGERVVMFFGTPQRHKGLEMLIEAVAALEREDVVLVLVGMKQGDALCGELEAMGRRLLGRRFVALGMQPMDRTSEVLSMADLVVIPQTAGPASRGQMPAKVFDAMAEAKPVIATACGDLPEVLDGCGVIVEPDDREALTEAMRRLLDDPEEAERLGLEAHSRWEERYCREAIADDLDELVERVLKEHQAERRRRGRGRRGSEVGTDAGQEHYLDRSYDSRGRFASYWHQVDEVLEAGPGRVLEVGTGNGFVAMYLKARGLDVLTVDSDEDLRPDVVGDVRDLALPDGSFDSVLCCQVLEHLPYEDFPGALSEIFRVTGSHAVISLPDHSYSYRLFLEVPRIGAFARVLSLSRPTRTDELPGRSHYWEIGMAGYPLRRIKRDIEGAGFRIRRTFRVFEHPYHRFFILEKPAGEGAPAGPEDERRS